MSARTPFRDDADRRRKLPVRVYRLGEEPGDDLSVTMTPEGRLALVWELTARAWALSGKALPVYERSEIPVLITRPR